MGVPLLVALLGQRAAGPAIVALAIDMVVTSSLCIALSRLDGASGRGARQAVGHALKGMLKNPLPWSILLGCLTAATGFELWAPARNTVGMLADGASPVALFTIGAVLARPQQAAAAGRWGDVPLVVFYKLLVHPALVLGIGRLAQAVGVPLDGYSLTVLVLIAALPSASSIPILAERYGADNGRIARIVLYATAASFFSFPAAVAWLV
jgi:predicted permease